VVSDFLIGRFHKTVTAYVQSDNKKTPHSCKSLQLCGEK